MNEQEIKQESQETQQKAIEAKTEALNDLNLGDVETEAVKGGAYTFAYILRPGRTNSNG
jgi:hypothetical protein